MVAVARGGRTSVSLTLEHTPEYLQQLKTQSQKMMKRRLSRGVLVLSAASGTLAYWLDRKAAAWYRASDAAYAQYRATSVADKATLWRQEAMRMDGTGDKRAKARNMAVGATSGLLGLSLVLFAVSF